MENLEADLFNAVRENQQMLKRKMLKMLNKR